MVICYWVDHHELCHAPSWHCSLNSKQLINSSFVNRVLGKSFSEIYFFQPDEAINLPSTETLLEEMEVRCVFPFLCSVSLSFCRALSLSICNALSICQSYPFLSGEVFWNTLRRMEAFSGSVPLWWHFVFKWRTECSCQRPNPYRDWQVYYTSRYNVPGQI